MIDQCLPAPGELRDDLVLWVELWLRAARHPRAAPRPRRGSTPACTSGSREAIAAGMAGGEFAHGDAGRTADRLLALIDGYGVRVLDGTPLMPLERARLEIWAAVGAELGIDAELPPLA